MIENDTQFDQTQRLLRLMQDALRSLRAEVLPKNKRNFAVLAEGPLEEIRRLQAEIDAYTGVTTALEAQSQIWLRLIGDQLHWPAVPTSLLTSYLESFRKGVLAVAEFLQNGQISGGRPTEVLEMACDFEVVAVRSGSICVGLRLPEVDSGALPPHQHVNMADQALDEFLKVAAWAASWEMDEVLDIGMADSMKRRVLLEALEPFLPRGQVEAIELSGWRVRGPSSIKLTRDTKAKVDAAIQQTIQERPVEHVICRQ